MISKKHIRNDLILILALLLASVLSWGIIRLTGRPGSKVIVTVNGSEVGSYPLDDDNEIDIITDDGHLNHLIIKDGKASVSEADCPDKLCVKHSPISLKGQTIVCLPHKLVIRIDGDSEVDAG